MELKEYSQGDEVKILDLFLKAFKKPLSMDFWKWRFGNNPFLEAPMIDLMWDNDVMAGHYAVSATEINVEGQVYPFSLSGTTMTSPGYEGKGIFSTLALDLYDRVKKDYNVMGVLGFPNKNSHYALVKKIKWKDVNVIPNFSIPGDSLPGISSALHEISNFTDEHAGFVQQSINALGFSVSVNRSVTYLNWRYINCPINKYNCFEYRDGAELKGIIITKPFQASADAKAEIDIVEIFSGTDLTILKELLNGVKYFYNTQGIAISQMNTWISILDPRHLEMEKIGFSIGAPLTFFCTKVFGSGFEQIYDYKNWYIAMGDSDVF